MTTRIIIAITVLLTLAVPLSALAMGSTDNPKAELQALIAAAEKEVAATSVWQQADKTKRQRLSEMAVRRKIISTVQSGFDTMQKLVDKAFDEVVDKSIWKIVDSSISPVNKQRIRELFKEEMYKLMYSKEDTNIEGCYDAARGTTGNLELLLSEGFKNNKIFENEIFDILKNVNIRMGGVISAFTLVELKTLIYAYFDTM